MINKQTRANLLLILTAFIWGSAFVAQSAGMNYIGPFTFNGIRYLIGGIVLLPVIFYRKRHLNIQVTKPGFKSVLLRGIVVGAILAVASSFQQIGILYTTAGKAGFITALYVILVPIFGLLFGKKSTLLMWLSALLAVIGMYFLCMTEHFSLSKGDSLVLVCAFLFTAHILVIDRFAPEVDGVQMSSIQFFTAGILCSIAMFITEEPVLANIIDAAVPILYAGVFSSGVAYTLQIVAQKDTSPTVASILMSLESVFAALCGWLILGDKMTVNEIMGCVIVFTAIILAQLPTERFKKEKK